MGGRGHGPEVQAQSFMRSVVFSFLNVNTLLVSTVSGCTSKVESFLSFFLWKRINLFKKKVTKKSVTIKTCSCLDDIGSGRRRALGDVQFKCEIILGGFFSL